MWEHEHDESVGRVARSRHGPNHSVLSLPTVRRGMKAVQFAEHEGPEAIGYTAVDVADGVGSPTDGLGRVRDGILGPRSRDTLPGDETARAHERLENREGFGTVVVPDSEQ